MDRKFTPGPWELTTKDTGGVYTFGVGTNGQTVFRSHTVSDEGKANAQLIAAAPNMFKALVDIVELHGTHDKELLRQECLKMANIARAAIDKVLGREEDQ